MTVKELVERLGEFPPEAEVKVLQVFADKGFPYLDEVPATEVELGGNTWVTIH
jgi:hypothetical protein